MSDSVAQEKKQSNSIFITLHIVRSSKKKKKHVGLHDRIHIACQILLYTLPCCISSTNSVFLLFKTSRKLYSVMLQHVSVPPWTLGTVFSSGD
jgi:hypothetical protein